MKIMEINEIIANFLCPEYGSYHLEKHIKKVIRKPNNICNGARRREVFEKLSGFVSGKNC